MNPIIQTFSPRRSKPTAYVSAAATVTALLVLAGCTATAPDSTPALNTNSSTPAPDASSSQSAGDAGGEAPSENPGAGTTVLDITDTAFSSREVTIAVGGTLTVTNTGQLEHSWTSDDGTISSGILAPGDSWTYTFTTAGAIPFHCEVHPTMTGTLIVL